MGEQDARRRSLQPTIKERALAWRPNPEGFRLSPKAHLHSVNPGKNREPSQRLSCRTLRPNSSSSGERLTPHRRLRQASSTDCGSPQREQFENECPLWPAFSARHKAREATSAALMSHMLGLTRQRESENMHQRGFGSPTRQWDEPYAHSGRLPSSGSNTHFRGNTDRRVYPHA